MNDRRVRARQYPWGIVEIENEEHCDFKILRDMLIRTHMQVTKYIYVQGGDYNTGNLGLYNTGILTAITPLTVLGKFCGFDRNNTTHLLISS